MKKYEYLLIRPQGDWSQHVDDAFLIIEKSYFDEIFAKYNNFLKDINWTYSEMDKNGLRFLDTTVYLDNDSNLQIKNFSKPESQSA